VYESKTKLEEGFATEAIATVGAISRLLPWSKYNSILWTTLTQFDRHPTQERYLIGLICALIDGFHFEVSIPTDEDASTDNAGSNSVWRALEKRLIPKVESLLVKEKSDRGGSKVKILRPPVIMALLKLFKKLPEHIFVSRLPSAGIWWSQIDSTLRREFSEDGCWAVLRRTFELAFTEIFQLHVRFALYQHSSVWLQTPILSGEQLVPFI
jgi:hypothetical protein